MQLEKKQESEISLNNQYSMEDKFNSLFEWIKDTGEDRGFNLEHQRNKKYGYINISTGNKVETYSYFFIIDYLREYFKNNLVEEESQIYFNYLKELIKGGSNFSSFIIDVLLGLSKLQYQNELLDYYYVNYKLEFYKGNYLDQNIEINTTLKRLCVFFEIIKIQNINLPKESEFGVESTSKDDDAIQFFADIEDVLDLLQNGYIMISDIDGLDSFFKIMSERAQGNDYVEDASDENIIILFDSIYGASINRINQNIFKGGDNIRKNSEYSEKEFDEIGKDLAYDEDPNSSDSVLKLKDSVFFTWLSGSDNSFIPFKSKSEYQSRYGFTNISDYIRNLSNSEQSEEELKEENDDLKKEFIKNIEGKVKNREKFNITDKDYSVVYLVLNRDIDVSSLTELSCKDLFWLQKLNIVDLSFVYKMGQSYIDNNILSLKDNVVFDDCVKTYLMRNIAAIIEEEIEQKGFSYAKNVLSIILGIKNISVDMGCNVIWDSLDSYNPNNWQGLTKCQSCIQSLRIGVGNNYNFVYGTGIEKLWSYVDNYVMYYNEHSVYPRLIKRYINRGFEIYRYFRMIEKIMLDKTEKEEFLQIYNKIFYSIKMKEDELVEILEKIKEGSKKSFEYYSKYKINAATGEVLNQKIRLKLSPQKIKCLESKGYRFFFNNDLGDNTKGYDNSYCPYSDKHKIIMGKYQYILEEYKKIIPQLRHVESIGYDITDFFLTSIHPSSECSVLLDCEGLKSAAKSGDLVKIMYDLINACKRFQKKRKNINDSVKVL
ncbi:MAG: hypothetical protein N4A49_05390 [Marinifilaceae bacterium]|jgi:hypothetical protein|nr:hypothetical protein [Marinifilaceae bacterium]